VLGKRPSFSRTPHPNQEHAARASAPPAMLCVYNTAGRCSGFVLNRFRDGFEAFDVNDRSLGLYPSVKAAAAAVSEAVS
jgi:hypothetical protein